jgi:hypothetical protein
VAEDIGDVDMPRVAADREARGNSAILHGPQRDRRLAAQVAGLRVEIERPHDLRPRAAAEKAPPVGRELEPVEGLGDLRLRNHRRRADVDDQDLVRPVARMQHGGEPAVRMHRDVDREVAQFDLCPDRSQRPLVRQQHRSVRLRPRPDGGGGGGGESQSQEECGRHRGLHASH